MTGLSSRKLINMINTYSVLRCMGCLKTGRQTEYGQDGKPPESHHPNINASARDGEWTEKESQQNKLKGSKKNT